MKRSLPTEIPATDAVRAQVVLAGMRCGKPIEVVSEALMLSADGLKSWLGRWTGSCAWPPSQVALEEAMQLPIAAAALLVGPVGRLASIAEGMAGLPAGSVAGRSRERAVVRVRQAVCWAIRERYGATWSYPMIGRALGGRDHSTVIHGIGVVEDLRGRDPEFAAFCDLLLMAARGSAMPRKREGGVLPDWALDPEGWLARQAGGDTFADADEEDEYDALPPKTGRWCDQCDALVGAGRAAACRDRWCSLKVRA